MNSVIILRTNISVNLAELTTIRFRHTNSTLRGPNAYEDGAPVDTAQTFGAQSNPGYSESLKRDTRRENNYKYQEDPGYATPDTLRKSPHVEANPIYASQADPGCETPGKPKDTAMAFGAQSNPGYSESLNRDTRGVNNDKYEEDPGYATPDIVRKPPHVEANPIYANQADAGYETPDFKTKEMNTNPSGRSTFDAEDSDPNIKRVEVNGDLYSLPSKGTVKVNLLHLQIRLATKTVSSVTVKKI